MGKKKGRGAVARDFETEYSQNIQESSSIKSNYEKLQENKNATLKFATNVAKSDKVYMNKNRDHLLVKLRLFFLSMDFCSTDICSHKATVFNMIGVFCNLPLFSWQN